MPHELLYLDSLTCECVASLKILFMGKHPKLILQERQWQRRKVFLTFKPGRHAEQLLASIRKWENVNLISEKMEVFEYKGPSSLPAKQKTIKTIIVFNYTVRHVSFTDPKICSQWSDSTQAWSLMERSENCGKKQYIYVSSHRLKLLLQC